MKKTIVLLLSLILLFSFVSCNGSTNSPSDSGSSNKIPSIEPDKNVPPTEQFESATPADCANILLAIKSITMQDPNSFELNEEITVKYTAKDGIIINEKKLEGTITKTTKTNMASNEHSDTYNGKCNIGGTSYEFIDFKIKNIPQSGPSASGTIKKEGTNVDLERIGDDAELSRLYYELGNPNCFDAQLLSAKGNQYAVLNSSDFVGGISSNMYSSDNYIVEDIVVNFSKISIGDSKNHTLTAEYKKLSDYFTDEKNLRIKYISFDKHYYTAESVLKDAELKDFINRIF